MALCTECDARIEYQGNGAQTDFTFPFEYDNTSEIYVSIWDEEQLKYVSYTDWSLLNPTTIKVKTPPTANIIIYRCTDVEQMRAVFHPGHAVKAGDLNDNFNQLANAIEEGRCAIGGVEDQLEEGWEYWLNRIDADDTYKGVPGDLVKANSRLTIDDDHVASTQWIDNRYWDQCEETTYSDDKWVDDLDDVHIPTTKAVEQRLSDLQALEGVQKVTGQMQREQKWDASVTNDNYVATTDALVERHDTYVNERNDDFVENRYTQPGKFWVKDDENILFYRRDSGSAWIQINSKGEKGDVGGDSTVPGPPGDAATITVGNTTTGAPGTDADVVNVGTPYDAVLEFTIPKGEKGDPGSGGEILTFTEPLVKTGTVVSINLLTIPNAP
jgi:hypothetical protein